MATLRVILRGLIRAPLFTVTAILSLAFGIGANTAIFSLIDQMLLRTLPVQNPEQLAYLYSAGPWEGSMSSNEDGGPSFSYPLMRAMQTGVGVLNGPFVGLAGARAQTVSIAYKNSAVHGSAHLVTGNYFELLGVRPALGRLFTAQDDITPGSHPVVVVNYAYWLDRFAADPGILNQTILINNLPMTVVGVAQKGFSNESPGARVELYLPISMREAISPEFKGLRDRREAWVTMFVRRKPGVSLAQAENDINLLYRGQVEEDAQRIRNPEFLKRFRERKMTLRPGEHGRGNLYNEARDPLVMLIGITAMVLLIASANVANLQLARSAARTREISVRLAVGASRWQLVRQLLAESCLLAVAGGVLSLAMAWATIRWIISVLPPSEGANSIISATLDPRILLFSFALAIATGIISGLFPALHATKTSLVTSLKDQAGQASSTGSANLFRKALVTIQITVALTLLISGGLFAKSLVNLAHVDLGIRADHLVTFSLLPKLNRYTDERVAQLHRDLTDRIAAIPGVTLATASLVPAIAGSNWSRGITVEGHTPKPGGGDHSDYNQIGVGYFRTMGMPLISGREFTEADSLAGPKVAVVNEAFVREFLPNQNPLGRHMAQDNGDKIKLDTEIVGVVKDAKYSEMKEPVPPVYYVPLAQNKQWSQLNYYARTTIPPQNAAPLLQQAVAAIDPNLPVRELKTMQKQIDENMFEERIITTLTASFAGLAVLLASVGLYGVLAFNIARRTREIGIRMALGAGKGNVRGLVMREVAWMLGIGTILGVAAALAGGKVVGSMLYGMKPWDAAIFAAAVPLLWLVAAAAAWIPARRATSVDPLIALRYE